MTIKTPAQQAGFAGGTPAVGSTLIMWIIFGITLVLGAFLFADAMVDMEQQWQLEEYSHGYMIPLVALYLFWKKLPLLPPLAKPGPWISVVLMLFAMLVYFVGQISTTYELMQYAMLLSLFSLALAFLGRQAVLVVWAAFFYLVFMIPLPAFVYKMLSSELQLISSSLGVAVIRLFDISVHLEGNVIDLGVYQLQVVEACSGLRYLFPLMSFGFLIAYLFKAPLWQRAFLFISAIPITVLMNSFRIGVIGVTVEYWGIEMAEGFLHDFEGWVVFMGCLGVLIIEMSVFHFFSKSKEKLLDRIDLDMPSSSVKMSDFNTNIKSQKVFLTCVLILAIALIAKESMDARDAPVLERKELNTFPLYMGSWVGHESAVTQEVQDSLKATDYLMANFRNLKNPTYINLWIAYYDSQRDGSGIHSPRTCLPGGGWEIKEIKEYTVPGVMHRSGQPLLVNRVLIQQGDQAQLVYYWFEQRGRNITNEYAAKWYILKDSFNDNRTDGALVRVVVQTSDIANIAAEDEKLSQFLQDFYPEIEQYIPGK